ncbi:MAG TPA: CapA family protein, partial [Streptosporangiaceae bacterium]
MITLCAVLVLAVAAGEWAAFAGAGGRAARHTHAGAVAAPRHGHSGGHVVRLVVEASGDLLIHSAVFERALVLGGGRRYNFAPLFAQIKPYIRRADLALCHVETPMTPAPATGYPVFNTPPELATAIGQTGWRACSTAATHTLDQGQRGVDSTIRALDRAGVAHTGSFSSAAARKTPLIMTVKGVRVAFLAYTELTNGIASPHPWSVNRASAARIISDARRARRDG